MSMFTRSPSWNGWSFGIPCAAQSFMLTQISAGNPTVGGAGFTPAFSIILLARALSRSPFWPGCTSTISVRLILLAIKPSSLSFCVSVSFAIMF